MGVDHLGYAIPSAAQLPVTKRVAGTEMMLYDVARIETSLSEGEILFGGTAGWQSNIIDPCERTATLGLCEHV